MTGKSKLTESEVLNKIRNEDLQWVDLQFVDLIGGLQHITLPAKEIDEGSFKAGIGKLDGSSIKGFKEIHESDMIMRPDPSTYAVLPWYNSGHTTARMIVDIYEGGGHERFSRDSRYIAQKAVKKAAELGYDNTYWGPELEFFVFDSVKLTPSPAAVRDSWAGCGYEINSVEAPWSQENGKVPEVA